MNILKIKRKKANDLPNLYNFSYMKAAKEAKEAAEATELPDLPNLSSLRSAQKRMNNNDDELPDLIKLIAQREKSQKIYQDETEYKKQIIQESLNQLEKYYVTHNINNNPNSNANAAVINDYYSAFNNADAAGADSEPKREKLKGKDLTRKYKYLKIQAFSLFLIVIGLVWLTLASLGNTREFKYNYAAVPVLAQDEKFLESIKAVVYDQSQDVNVTGKQNIRYINQLSEGLPNGCEVVSLTMVLSQFIQGINPHEVVEKYLPKAEIGIYNGVYISQDPTYYYIGDPAGKGYGIFAEGLAKAAENSLKAYQVNREVINISGCSEADLFRYVENGYPVIVWATLGMTPVERGRWNWHLPTGQLYRYPGNQHCYVLIEVSEDKVVLYDPRDGTVSYDKSLFARRWREMGPYENITRQAIVIR